MMVLISAGYFQMGSDAGGQFERPMRQVFLEDYWIDEIPVTNRRFAKFVADTGYHTEAQQARSAWGYRDTAFAQIPHLSWLSYAGPGREDHPVVLVSWNDANAYAAWAGAQLPTEAEWEKAARGGAVGRLYPWGDSEPNGTQCNFARSPGAPPPTTPVFTFAPNALGIYDMTGNVWQWCADSFDSHAYSRPGSPTEGSDCFVLPDGLKTRRGGGWNVIQPFRLRCSNRGALPASSVAPNLGFRCCSRTSNLANEFQQVTDVLQRLRPAMQADGGDAQLVSLEGGVAYIRLYGACLVCPSADLTMKHGIERSLREQLPWISHIIRVA